MKKRTLIITILLSCLTFLNAQGSLAGSEIVNEAELTYKVNGFDFKTKSNTLRDVVDQVIRLDISCNSASSILVQEGELQRALPFTIKNNGNGSDIFSLTPETPATTPEVNNRKIFLDDGDGIFSPSDILITDINLSEDEQKVIFFVSDIPSPVLWTTSTNGIKAISNTGGSGIKGSIHDLGINFAVDGEKGGIDQSFCIYEISDLKLILKKTATISSSKLFTGSIIHYKIDVNVDGDGIINNIIFEDPLPIGSEFIPNTIKLDGVNLDNSHLISDIITVNIPNMTKDDTHHVEFDVKVK